VHLGLDERAIQDLRRDFYAGDRINPVVLDVITRLRPHYKQAILSNAVPSLLEMLRDRFQIVHLFDVIITSASIRVMKPDPQAYRAALDALRLRAEETVFIDDLRENIQGAKQLGMHAIHFETDHDDIRPLLSALLGRADL
jgi:putative hydrolase of the HAD superfamily